MDSGLFRNDEESLRARFRALKEAHEERRGVALELGALGAARGGRFAGGLAGILSLVVLLFLALLSHLQRNHDSPSSTEAPALFLFAAPFLCVGLGVGVYGWKRRAANEEHDNFLAETGDLRSDVERLSGSEFLRERAERVERSERWSLAAPLIAAALLAPLFLHTVFFAVLEAGNSLIFGRVSYQSTWTELTGWIQLSVILVGHCHLVLAFLGWRYTGELHRATTETLSTYPNKGWRAWIITTGVSLFPGLFLLGIPSIVVFITGIFFIPAMFGWALRRALKERDIIEQANQLSQQAAA